VESVVIAGLATALPAPRSVFIVAMSKDSSMPGCGSALAVGAAAVEQCRRLRIARRRTKPRSSLAGRSQQEIAPGRGSPTGGSRTVTHLARAASFLALLILLAGCGATPASGSDAGASTGKPPASAAMICDADIKSKVREALSLAGPPSTEWRWSNGVYTCDYHLPMGRMSLQVTVLAGARQARTLFNADRARTPGARPLAGLGERAIGTENGTVLVLKDNQILVVDTTRLPPEFGANGQRRTDLAYEVASDVMGCWTGD
jgi:hypothetical protein